MADCAWSKYLELVGGVEGSLMVPVILTMRLTLSEKTSGPRLTRSLPHELRVSPTQLQYSLYKSQLWIFVEATRAEMVFTGVSDNTDLQGTLFQGRKFWLSQKVPQRSRFIADIKVRWHGSISLIPACINNFIGQWRRSTSRGEACRRQDCRSREERGIAGNVCGSAVLALNHY